MLRQSPPGNPAPHIVHVGTSSSHVQPRLGRIRTLYVAVLLGRLLDHVFARVGGKRRRLSAEFVFPPMQWRRARWLQI